MILKNRGQLDEQLIIRYLSKEFVTEIPTNDENIKGVDCYINGIPVDIKSNNYHESRSLPFELYVQLRTGDWKRSWYYIGAALRYVYMYPEPSGERCIYIVNRLELMEYVYKNEWDYTSNLSELTKQKQLNSNRAHVDSLCGYISLDKLLELGIAEKYCTVTLSEYQDYLKSKGVNFKYVKPQV